MKYLKKKIRYFFVWCTLKLYHGIRCSSILHCIDNNSVDDVQVKRSIKSILVIRLDEIGDMVMLSPFLKNLRKWKPDAKITLVVKPQVVSLFEACPYVDDVKVFKRCDGRFAYVRNMWKAYHFCQSNLHDEYDLSIAPRWDSDIGYWAGYISMFSKAHQRLAYSSCVNELKADSDAGFDGFYTDVIKVTKSIHEVERSLDLLRYLGADIEVSGLELWLKNDVSTQAVLRKEKAKLDGIIRIALFLSCGMPKKEWDVSNYATVINRLSSVYDLEIVLGGAGNRAEEYAKEFKTYYPSAINLVGKTSLSETVQLLKSCDCYLGGDTGPMHMAVACGIPGVALYLGFFCVSRIALDTPERFGPWMSEIVTVQPEKMLPGCDHGCMKNYAHCINTIKVETVYEKMCKILDDVKSKKTFKC